MTPKKLMSKRCPACGKPWTAHFEEGAILISPDRIAHLVTKQGELVIP